MAPATLADDGTTELVGKDHTQLGRAGDFQVGDTVFHVTVSLGRALVDKCLSNISRGLRVYVLVPERNLRGDKDFVEQEDPARIAVRSVESFVSQNIDELSEFARDHQRKRLSELFHTYNERVRQVETDRSFLIDMPASLLAG